MSFIRTIIACLAVFTNVELAGQAAATSRAVGVMSTDVPQGLSGTQFPIIPKDALTSFVAGHVDMGASGKVLHGVVLMSSTSPASVIGDGGSYYLEITEGALEGERFEVDEAATQLATPGTLVIDLSDSLTTHSATAAGSLVGMKAAIRPHMTLSGLQARITPPMVGNNQAALADGVLIFSASSAITYYLRGDGVTWRKAGSTTDFSRLIIPPDQSIMLQMRSGAKELRQSGVVRANSFRVSLKSGVHSAAAGYPDSLSPIEFGATSDPLAPQLAGWVGSNQQSLADAIMVFDPERGSFVTYYLRADGITWRMSGSTTDVSAAKLIRPDAMIMVRRKHADPSNLVIRPY